MMEGKLVIVIGDVTDKGVPAALVMASVRTILRGTAQRGMSPASALKYANETLVLEMLPYMFVTCFYLILDVQSGHLIYANAGHCWPFVNQKNQVVKLTASGMPLGLMEGMQYDEFETTILPGDLLLLYSDGLIEAHNEKGEMLGTEKVKEILSDHQYIQIGTQEVLEAIKRAWNQHSDRENDPEDDMTLVSIYKHPMEIQIGDVSNGNPPD